jgi:hypothetical protein
MDLFILGGTLSPASDVLVYWYSDAETRGREGKKT